MWQFHCFMNKIATVGAEPLNYIIGTAETLKCSQWAILQGLTRIRSVFYVFPFSFVIFKNILRRFPSTVFPIFGKKNCHQKFTVIKKSGP